VGREKSISALEAAMNGNRQIFLAAQRNAKTEEPRKEDIFTTGTISQIVQLLKLPDGTVRCLLRENVGGLSNRLLPATSISSLRRRRFQSLSRCRLKLRRLSAVRVRR